MTNKIIFIIALLLNGTILTANAAHTRAGRIIVIIAGNTSIRDLTQPGLPHIAALLRDGSVGLMNVRTAKPPKDAEPTLRPTMAAGCLTLGAGAMAAGGAEVARAGNSRDALMGINLGELHSSRTGLKHKLSNILHPEIIKMQRINDESAYHANVGALGTALRAAGIRTAVIGNSDMLGEAHREAVAAAMDENGIVDEGDTYTNNLIDQLNRVLQRCRFVVIDFGDTTRADLYAQYCTDAQAMRLRLKAVRNLDKFLSLAEPKLDFNKDLLILLSPNSRTFSDIEEERLAPIIIKGHGYEPGRLMSPSTRRAGLVTLSDVAPTILSWLKVPIPKQMVGRPIHSIEETSAVDAALKLNLSASVQAQRQVAMRGSSVAQSIVVVLATIMLLFGCTGKLRSALTWAVLVTVALPLVMIYLPIIYAGGLIGSVIWLVVLTVAVVGICVRAFHTPIRALVWLCGIVAISIMLDLLRGAPLISASIAGYSPIEGARYYGIGNELVGTLLGAVLVCVGLALSSGKIPSKIGGIVAAILFGAVFVTIAAPGLGAEVGGALAALPAFAALLLLRRGWNPTIRGIVLIFIACICIVGLLFAIDAARGTGGESHIGRFIGRVSGGGVSELVSVFGRKIGLNLMLVSTSLWSRLLGLSLAGSFVLWYYGRRKFGVDFLDREQSATLIGCVIGTIGVFAFNDSGVVAAAAFSVLTWCLLALVYDAKKGGRDSRPPKCDLA